MAIDLTQDLRLEVEVPTTGLPNLVQNPNGAFGSWGWITPLANQKISADSVGLYFTSTTTNASGQYWYTEPMAVAANQHVAARFDFSSTTIWHAARIDYLNSSRVHTGQSAWTNFTPGAGTKYLPAAQVPAGTAYVRLRIELGGTGGSAVYPDTASTYGGVGFSNVMVTAVSPTVRTNRAVNPSSESVAYVMEGSGSATTTVSPTQAFVGTNSTKFVWTSGSRGVSIASAVSVGNTSFTLPANKTYTISFYTYVESGALPQYTLRNNTYGVLGASLITSSNETISTTGAWQRTRYTFTTDVYQTFRLYGAVGAASTHYVDGVLLEEGSTLGTYFDGASSSPGHTFAWTGTANNSTSTDTFVSIATYRTNLVPNPSFEINTVTWANVTRDTALFFGGIASGRVASGAMATSDPITVSGGGDYTFSAFQRADSASTPVVMRIAWQDSSGAPVGSAKTLLNTLGTSFTRYSVTTTAPGGAAKAVLSFNGTGNFNFDAVLLENTPGFGVLQAYFDGTTAATASKSYAWAGTAHASQSIETDTSFAFMDPVQWQNIIGPTAEINVERKDLDVGLLNATILDAALDPALANSIIKPGKKVRLRHLSKTSSTDPGIWTSLYEGKITNGRTNYDPDRKGHYDTQITISAADNVSQLANQGENSVLKNVADLPYILEGKGVPWNINGSGNQVTSATVVAYNENASTLDQVGITRDTNLAYGWVSKENVLRVNSPVAVPAQPSINGTFETNVTGWTGANATLARNTANFRTGVASMSITNTSASTAATATTPSGTSGFAVMPNAKYTASAWFKAPVTTAQGAVLFIIWYDAAGVSLSTSPYQTLGTATTAWTNATLSAIAPANAAYGAVRVYMSRTSIGEILYVDDVSMTFSQVGVLTDSATPLEGQVSYSDIDVDYNTDDCINSVTIKWLRYDVGSSRTTEITYGPYEDAPSIAQYGPRSKEFTICGAAADENPTYIAAFANSILVKNATPTVKARSLTYPVKAVGDGYLASFQDLYDLVQITFSNKLSSVLHRVTGIEHNITPDEWKVKYLFSDTGSVAQPTMTPSPPFQGVGVPDGVWQNYNPALGGTGWNGSGCTTSGRWTRIGNTIHFYATVTLGSGFAVGANAVPAVSLPVPQANTQRGGNLQLRVVKAGVNTFGGFAHFNGPTWVSMYYSAATGGYDGTFALFQTASPSGANWAVGDNWDVWGTYEAA